MKLETMKNNFGTEFELKKNLENDLVPDEELDNVLTTGASVHLAEDAEAEVNDEENDVESEGTGNNKERERQRKRKKWSVVGTKVPIQIKGKHLIWKLILPIFFQNIIRLLTYFKPLLILMH